MAVLGVDISTRKIAFVFVGDDEAVAWQDEREVKGKLQDMSLTLGMDVPGEELPSEESKILE